MKQSERLSLVSVVLVLGMIVSGCARPPEKEMKEAEQAMKAAMDAGADKYADKKYGEGNQALSDAKSKTEAKEYKAARMAAKVAKAKFEAASGAVADGKSKMKAEVEPMWNEVNTTVTELEPKLAKMKLSKEDKAKVSEKVAAIKETLAAAKAALDGGDVAGARDKVQAAKTGWDEVAAMTQEKK
jgi:hypothetical protein